LVVSIGAALLVLFAHKQNATGWMRAMLDILVLFNSLVPVHLRRDTWRLIDLVVAGGFVTVAFSLRSTGNVGRDPW
jgi:hypothetical protein